MGIVNMFIVIPMIIQIFTLPLYFPSWLQGNPENVVWLAGVLMLCAAAAVLIVRYDGVAAKAEGGAIWRAVRGICQGRTE